MEDIGNVPSPLLGVCNDNIVGKQPRVFWLCYPPKEFRRTLAYSTALQYFLCYNHIRMLITPTICSKRSGIHVMFHLIPYGRGDFRLSHLCVCVRMNIDLRLLCEFHQCEDCHPEFVSYCSAASPLLSVILFLIRFASFCIWPLFSLSFGVRHILSSFVQYLHQLHTYFRYRARLCNHVTHCMRKLLPAVLVDTIIIPVNVVLVHSLQKHSGREPKLIQAG